MLDNLLEKRVKVKLDVKDIRILYELIRDGRQSISKIAKKVKLSKQGVKYKMERLTKSGIIEGYFSIVDVYKLGYLFHRVFFRFQSITPEKLKEINDFAARNSKVSLITNYFGDWDTAFIVCVNNAFEFNEFLRQFYNEFEPYIRDEKFSIITDIYCFSHSYSDDKYLGAEAVHVGGNLGSTEVDDFDNKLLNLLAANGRIPIFEMARRLHVSDKKIVYRMKKLIEQKIILGFKAVLNNDVLELEQYKVFLTLKNINEQRERDMINFCKHHKKIITLTKVLGTRSMEIDMVVSNKRETWDIIKKMELEFKDIISNTLTVGIVTEKHIRCLPI